MPHFLIIENFVMPHFSYLILNYLILFSKYKHVINFNTEKEPKMELFDFGIFQNSMQMLSHDKIILQMLFGTFHNTSRTYLSPVENG